MIPDEYVDVWIAPDDYETEEIELDLLPSMKGTTPQDLPSLDEDDDDEGI